MQWSSMGRGIVLCMSECLCTCIYMNTDSPSQKLAKDRDSHDRSSDDEDLHDLVPSWNDEVKNTTENYRVSVGIYQHWRSKPTTKHEYAISLGSANFMGCYRFDSSSSYLAISVTSQVLTLENSSGTIAVRLLNLAVCRTLLNPAP